MPFALISVTDKTGVVELAQGLRELGFSILSTGGTAKALRNSGIELTTVAEHTGQQEILGGRVKTLHPLIHGGLLAPTHDEAKQHGIEPIDVLAVNLYAFREVIGADHTREDAVEAIDIGGPAMIRAAAKNSARVLALVDPADYGAALECLASGAGIEEMRARMMAKAFRHTAAYDAAIARYLTGNDFAEALPISARRIKGLRYGENPHQRAALYALDSEPPGIAQAEQLWGAELSYNNILDCDAAWSVAQDLPPNSCAIIKHGNPCGAGFAAHASESFELAKQGDPISAYGGIVGINGPVDLATAKSITAKGNFFEAVVASAFDRDALQAFKDRKGWGQSVRLLACPSGGGQRIGLRSVGGGLLAQTADQLQDQSFQTVTTTQPNPEQLTALKLAWAIAKHVKSNAIAIATPQRLTGVGAGQMNRVQSVRLAIEQAGDAAAESALASDAFFPFPDSIETTAQSGIRAIIQPGGSKNDQNVIEKANDLGVAMVFTGSRHFRH